MKKTYMTPQMDVVMLQAMATLLSVSGPTGSPVYTDESANENEEGMAPPLFGF